jgi:prophage DNA circulation protein
MSFVGTLRPASWRGVPFSVLNSESDLARAVAVHEYPFRDDVWVEDLGGGRNAYAIRGRLVGEDVIALRDQMLEAVKTPGTGELIHPTFGSLRVSCVQFRPSEAWDEGRVIELDFVFLKSGDRLYPSSPANSAASVLGAADIADMAARGDFLGAAKAAFTSGREAVARVTSTAQAYVGTATRLVRDAASTLRSVTSIVPGLDRVVGRYVSKVQSQIGRYTNLATTYVNRAATARSKVEGLGTTLTAAAKRL